MRPVTIDWTPLSFLLSRPRAVRSAEAEGRPGHTPKGVKRVRTHTVQKIRSHAHAQKRKSFFWFRRGFLSGRAAGPTHCALAMEKWQRDGFKFNGFGEWRRADQKRCDDAKMKAARAAAAPLPPPPLRGVLARGPTKI